MRAGACPFAAAAALIAGPDHRTGLPAIAGSAVADGGPPRGAALPLRHIPFAPWHAARRRTVIGTGVRERSGGLLGFDRGSAPPVRRFPAGADLHPIDPPVHAGRPARQPPLPLGHTAAAAPAPLRTAAAAPSAKRHSAPSPGQRFALSRNRRRRRAEKRACRVGTPASAERPADTNGRASPPRDHTNTAGAPPGPRNGRHIPSDKPAPCRFATSGVS